MRGIIAALIIAALAACGLARQHKFNLGPNAPGDTLGLVRRCGPSRLQQAQE